MPRHVRRVVMLGLSVGLAVGLVVSGCSSAPSSTPTPQVSGAVTPSDPSGSAAPTSATTPAPTPAATPTPTPEAENSYTPPVKTPGVPDPSTAGRLSASSFPNPVLGFTGEVVDPDEGEYNPNGTWVHAIDGTQASFESLPQCAAVQLSDVPRPTAALTGTYRSSRDEPGNALGLQFADDATATTFFDLYADQLRACAAAGSTSLVVVTDLEVGDTTITGRRAYSPQEKWSEMIKRSGDVVILVILADGHRSSEAVLTKTVQEF